MNNEKTIPRGIALELCEAISQKNWGKWYTFSGLMCWGCTTFTKGDPLKRCFASRPDYRGCFQVNARYEALLRETAGER